MKTSRSDIERNKKQAICKHASWLGYSISRLHYLDLFLYRETYTDGSIGYRLAKCHGQGRPDNRDNMRDGRNWRILAQVASEDMRNTYERWVDPEDVTEIIPKQNANTHILAFFTEQEDN